MRPSRFIAEAIEVRFDEAPAFEKKPPCPDAFTWRGEDNRVVAILRVWHDFGRRGRMARNMRLDHLATATLRGSWGVGRFYFRVRVESGRVFDLYYDRAPKSAADGKGAWYLLRELVHGP